MSIDMIWFYSCALVFIITITTSSATDTIYLNQTLKDGQTIVSSNEVFELGFFNPGNSSLRYLGIWYKKISTGTVVWVANREVPLDDPTGILRVNDKGNLELRTAGNNKIWSSQSPKTFTNITNPVARILDSGNLVIKDETNGQLVWQSFDYPGDTLLSGMKIGVDLETRINRNLTSWKSSDNPSAGPYTVWLDIQGFPQLYNMKDESSFQQRIGYWNGLGFTGMLALERHNFYELKFVSNYKEIYYTYQDLNTSVYTRITLDSQGRFSHLVWIDGMHEWVLYSISFRDQCDKYRLCGPYGSCSIGKGPRCACLRGFEPKLPEEWSRTNWENGCKLDKSMTPENGLTFRKFTNLKLPDSKDAWFNCSMSLSECKNLCANNISCTAYANTDIRMGGRGCLMWSSELIDIREASNKDISGQDIYIRMTSLNSIRDEKKKKKKSYFKVILSVPLAVVLLSFALGPYAWTKRKKSHHQSKDGKQDLELPLFRFNKIAKSTGNFSINNKLGQGGFGAVYKGVLEDGGEIAVKRLSKTSSQGLVEFQNEVICIAKLQHRNVPCEAFRILCSRRRNDVDL